MSEHYRTLPFDEDAIVAALMDWARCESPTWDAAAVGRMMDIAARDLALLGAQIERLPGRMGFGDCIRARLPHAMKQATPGVLVLAHLDTVHPVGTLAHLPVRREGDRIYGPGIYDMKGGTYLAIEALRQIARARLATALPVTILLTPDEEVGTPSARDLIEAEAARAAFVLVPEPARPDGGVVTGRYAIARFDLRATGRPSHAGARLSEGRSAIREMCRRVLEIEAMTTEDVHVLGRRDRRRAVGQLRRHDLRCGGAEHGQAPAGPGRGRRAHDGAQHARRRRPASASSGG